MTEGFVLREPGSGTRATFLDALPGGPQIALEVSTTAAALAAAAAGVGPTVVSHRAARHTLRRGSVVSISVEIELSRPLLAIWKRGRTLQPPVSDLLRLITPDPGTPAPPAASSAGPYSAEREESL